MSIPKYHELYNIFLASLSDGQVHSMQECYDYIKQRLNLTPDELAETISSGQSTLYNRVSWCKTYLQKAGLINRPERGKFKITDKGNKILSEGTKITDKLLLERFPSYVEFKFGKKQPTKENVISEKTPQELFDVSYKEITDNLAEELLESIMSVSPKFFESLVVKLMEGMGYGTGEVTPYVKDSGIDGIIYGDKLKFDRIGIQAKHFKIDSTIGAPDIRQFIGALRSQGFDKGIFITSSKFSKEAIKEAERNHIILVDGKKLTELMIEFDVGVSTQKVYKIKRVDNDFFSEE